MAGEGFEAEMDRSADFMFTRANRLQTCFTLEDVADEGRRKAKGQGVL